MDNKEIIKEYIQSRGLKKTTHDTYQSILENYSTHQQKTLQELIEEADKEEEERIRWKKRKLKKRLNNYMNYLTTKYKISTAKTYMNIVKSFYHHHEIEIQHLPRLNLKNGEVSDPILYTELPNRDIIQKALGISSPLMKALILFLVTTGMSRVDTLKLTIQDFIDATFDYHHKEDITNVLEVLETQKDIIPTFRLRRSKTNKYFVTFTTPECVHEILSYLQIRNKKKTLKSSDKLFKISKITYILKFEEINDTLQLGKVGTYNRFRGHMLRKFHASNLEKDGMNRYQINVLQGKSNGAVDDVYFLEDTEHLREEFIRHMGVLVFDSDVNLVDVYSDEYLSLLEENKKLRLQSEKIDGLADELESIKSWYLFD